MRKKVLIPKERLEMLKHVCKHHNITVGDIESFPDGIRRVSLEASQPFMFDNFNKDYASVSGYALPLIPCP